MKQDPIETAPAQSRVPGRELVLLRAEGDAVSSVGDRPLAGFVAQLIACGRRLPAYRAKGRASPETATRSYERDGLAAPLKCQLDLTV